MKATKSALYGFIGESVDTKGILFLPVELRMHPCQHIQTVHFVVVNCPLVYNVTIRHPTLDAIRAIVSTYHLFVKFPIIGGIDILQGQLAESRDIYKEAS